MLLDFAHNAYDAIPADNAAVFAHAADGSTNFHGLIEREYLSDGRSVF